MREQAQLQANNSQTIQQFESKNKELLQQISTNEKLKFQLDQFKQTNKNLEDNLVQLQNKYKQLSVDHDQLIQEVTKQDTTIEMLQQQNEQLINQCTDMRNDNKKLSEELLNQRKNIDDQEQIISQLVQKYKTDVTKTKQDNQQIIKDNAEAIALKNKLKADLDNYISKYQQLTAKYDQLQQKYDNQTKISDQTIKSLQKQIDEQNYNFVNKTSEIQASTNTQIERLSKQLQEQQQLAQQLSIDKAKQEALIQEQSNRLILLKQSLDVTQKQKLLERVQKMKNDMAVLETENQTLRQQVQEKQDQAQQLAEIQIKHQVLMEQNNSLINEVKALKLKISELQTQNILEDQNNNQAQYQDDQTTQIQQQLIEKLRDKLVEAAKQIQSLIEQNRQLQKQQMIFEQQSIKQQHKSEIDLPPPELSSKIHQSQNNTDISKLSSNNSELIQFGELQNQINNILKQ